MIPSTFNPPIPPTSTQVQPLATQSPPTVVLLANDHLCLTLSLMCACTLLGFNMLGMACLLPALICSALVTAITLKLASYIAVTGKLITRVCSCNIFNRRAKQLVKVICTLTYWTKPKILQWLWQCGSCIHTDRRLYNAYHKHLESHAPTIHLAPL